MATTFPVPVTAAQVGTYFVGQYYQVLQSQPDFVHQFYSDASTMLRIDEIYRETATGMLQIHTLIMSLNYIGIEIKTAHSLESWNGGVLVMVSGSVQIKNLTGKRKFMQTFFLALQEKGCFVVNEIFHFVDEEPIHHHPAILLAQSNLDASFNTSTVAEPVSTYLLGGEIQTRDSLAPADLKENFTIENYSFTKQELQQVPEPENVLVDSAAEENGTLQNSLNVVQDQLPASVKEPVGEPQKLTYASILRVAKAQSAPSVSPQPTINKNVPPASESKQDSQDTRQPVASSNAFEWSGGETVEEFSAIEDEDEIKSIYVRSLLPTTSEAEIEEEFRKFGEIKPGGAVIRSRKDVGVCFAFVEFEDISGVHNAVRAGTAQVGGRPVYIEERRPNSIPYRVGRGRGSYQTDAPRGRFGTRSLGRGSGYDESERDYSRTRGNGYHRPGPRQDRGLSAHQVSRSGQYQSDYAS